jgi:hypothetical protein
MGSDRSRRAPMDSDWRRRARMGTGGRQQVPTGAVAYRRAPTSANECRRVPTGADGSRREPTGADEHRRTPTNTDKCPRAPTGGGEKLPSPAKGDHVRVGLTRINPYSHKRSRRLWGPLEFAIAAPADDHRRPPTSTDKYRRAPTSADVDQAETARPAWDSLPVLARSIPGGIGHPPSPTWMGRVSGGGLGDHHVVTISDLASGDAALAD